ncbi:MAG: GNAT family N-acetyltransferase [Bacilli bacterium]|nr:GNAT family N-acetyltransferase [Bacilli bacterium]
MLFRIYSDAFKGVYKRMGEEFPPSEMKPFEAFSSLLGDGKYICLALKEDEEIKGYCLGCPIEGGYFYLDYLHVYKENQGRGYGQKILRELLSSFGESGVFLETEPVEEDEDYDSNKSRRMRFYDRFDIACGDFEYRFPCVDGGSVHLVLDFIPGKKTHVDADTIRFVIKSAHDVIHAALPHKDETMALYFNDVKDILAHRFSFTGVDMEKEEEIETVGRLIYHTDPYVYPDYFEGDIEMAAKVAKGLLLRENVYNHKHILVGRIDGEIAGYLTVLDSYPKDNHEEMKRAFLDTIGYLPPLFDKVMKGYFDELSSGWEGTQILSLAVLPKYRRLGVARKMLNSLPKDKTYTLACVKENRAGRRLYAKCGYVLSYEYPGYTDVPCVELIKRRKEK